MLSGKQSKADAWTSISFSCWISSTPSQSGRLISTSAISKTCSLYIWRASCPVVAITTSCPRLFRKPSATMQFTGLSSINSTLARIQVSTTAALVSIFSPAWSGKENQNWLPSPSSEWTPISPFIANMMRLLIARPSPVPPVVFRPLLVWLNASNKHFCSLSCIPTPVSDTSNMTRFSSSRSKLMKMSTSPLSVNLIALPTRLFNIWLIRVTSPRQ